MSGLSFGGHDLVFDLVTTALQAVVAADSSVLFAASLCMSGQRADMRTGWASC